MAFNPGPNKTQVIAVDFTGSNITLLMGYQQCRIWNAGPDVVSLTFSDSASPAIDDVHLPPGVIEVFTKLLLVGMTAKTLASGKTAELHIVQGTGD